MGGWGLKKCPFCGGEALLRANYTYKYHTWFVNAKCDVCGAQGATAAEPNDVADENYSWETDACRRAVMLWNREYKGEI